MQPQGKNYYGSTNKYELLNHINISKQMKVIVFKDQLSKLESKHESNH